MCSIRYYPVRERNTPLIYSNLKPLVMRRLTRYHFLTPRELHFCTESTYLYRMRLEKRVPTFAFSTCIIFSVLCRSYLWPKSSAPGKPSRLKRMKLCAGYRLPLRAIP